jgi:Zn finger protein HypA/HybF involved in hydrogenase expression
MDIEKAKTELKEELSKTWLNVCNKHNINPNSFPITVKLINLNGDKTEHGKETLINENNTHYCTECNKRTIFFERTNEGIKYICPQCYENHEENNAFKTKE